MNKKLETKLEKKEKSNLERAFSTEKKVWLSDF
jgi:hypothetical protein